MLRPVTPLGIIASDLEDLRRHASTMAQPDHAFVARLEATTRLATGLDRHLSAASTPESPLLAELARDTASRDWAQFYADGETAIPLEGEMISGHVEGQFLKFIVRMSRAKRVLEIGVFTGYSALAMAEALPSDGTLVACEIDPFAAGIAQQWFDRSPSGKKIEVRIGPAMTTLERLHDENATFDLVFIDADKAQYAAYVEFLVAGTLLAPSGFICVDNTLMQGDAYLAEPRTANGRAIVAFNAFVAAQSHLDRVVLPIRDGVTLITRAVP